MNHSRWALLVLFILVLPASCGEGSPAEEPTTEETTTATNATASNLDYVALGDSLATGYGASSGYVDRYADLLGRDTGTTVSVRNLGVNGLRSEQLRTGIEQNQRVRDAIEQAEIVTINSGANDLLWGRWEYKTGECGGPDNQACLRQAVDDFQTNWDAILARVTAMRSPDATIIRTMDFYNPSVDVDRATTGSPDTDASDFVVFKKYLEQVNSHIAESSGTYGIPHARVYEAFNGPNGDQDPSVKGYMSPDGIHPNDDGHALIAQELRKLAYEPLYD